MIGGFDTVQATDVYVLAQTESIRQSLCKTLTNGGFRVKSFASAAEFLSLASSLRPGCLVAELMPSSDGTGLLHHMRALKYLFPAVFVTSHGDIKSAVQAMRAGAMDYLHHPTQEELFAGVQAAQQRLLEIRQQETSKDAATRVVSLSTREREILERLVAGMPNKTIAQILDISPRTVEFHRSHIMAKMQANNLADLVRMGLAAGIQIKMRAPAVGEG